jgi:hypothetical protein
MRETARLLFISNSGRIYRIYDDFANILPADACKFYAGALFLVINRQGTAKKILTKKEFFMTTLRIEENRYADFDDDDDDDFDDYL